MSKETDKTTTVHVNLIKDSLALFDKAYPSARRRFFQRCLDRAVNDKLFFEKIFFSDIVESNGFSLDNV